MLNQVEGKEADRRYMSSSSFDEGIYVDDEALLGHRPVELILLRDKGVGSKGDENFARNSSSDSVNLITILNTNKRLAKLRKAYDEICRKTITIVHSQSVDSMFSATDSLNHDGAYSPCNLLKKYSENNLLPPEFNHVRSKRKSNSSQQIKDSRKDSDGSRSLRPSCRNSVCKLMTRMLLETLLSYVRNIGCYMFIVCFTAIITLHPEPIVMSKGVYETDVALLLVGSLIFSWQIFYIIKQLFKYRVTAIHETLLHNLADFEEFEEIVRQKRSCPPYLTLELKVKKLSTFACFLFGCCTCCRRGMDNLLPKRHCTILYFDSWSDASYVEFRKASRSAVQPSELPSRHQTTIFQNSIPSTPHMVILSKDYRMVDKKTSSSVEEETKHIKTLFSNDLGISETHVMSEINVDVEEGLRFPDAEAFLILDRKSLDLGRQNSKKLCAKHPFFSSKTLLLFSMLAIDCIYYTIFLLRTSKPTRFFVVKNIKRHSTRDRNNIARSSV